MTSRLLLALACLAATPSCQKKAKTGPVVVAESSQQRTDGVQAAFIDGDNTGSKAVAADSKLFQDIDAVFSDLGKASRSKDGAAFVTRLSPEAMVQLLDTNGYVKPRNDKDRKAMTEGLRQGLSRVHERMAFDRHELIRLEHVTPKQVLAFTRLHDDEMEVTSKLRWWLIEEDGQWRIYDFEDLDQGIRTSTLMGSMLAGGLVTKAAWVQPFVEFVKASNAMTDPEADTDLAKIRADGEAILKEAPPAEIENYVRTVRVSTLQTEGDHEAALVELEKLAQLPNTSPLARFLKGSSLAALEKHDEALAEFAAYGDALGWDRDVHEAVADVHLAAGNKETALEHALKGLATGKNSLGCLASAALAAGPGRIGELKPHFDATRDPESAYETVIDHALESDDEEVAKAVLGLLKEKLPESELVESYEEIFSEGAPEEAE